MTMRFSPKLQAEIREALSRSPAPEASLLPVLHLVQDEFGHIPAEAERAVAELLGLNPVRVREVVTFYSMFRGKPLGRYHLQVCVNLACSLGGGPGLLHDLRESIGLSPGGATPDGLFSLSTVECLGLCEEAPCLLVNEERYEKMDRDKLQNLLGRLRTRDGG